MAAAALAASILLPQAINAAPFQAGTYEATDWNDIRSIWTGPGNDLSATSHIVTGAGASNMWTVGGTSVFTFDGTNGTLTGTATNIGAAGANLSFDFVLNMVLDPTNDPYCRPAICDNTDESMWALFDLTSGSMTGVAGTAMDGLTYILTQRSKHGPQAGVGANDKEAGELGFSMWFDWSRTDNTDTSGRDYTFNSGGYGDFNMDLNAVPVPAAGWLLLAGLGGLAAARRRKSAA